MRRLVLALLLAGCADDGLPRDMVDVLSRACLNQGAVPRVHYSAVSNQITGVTCEPK